MGRQVELWDGEDTLRAMREDGASGLEVSDKKWGSMAHGIVAIYDQAKNHCGLCLEYKSQESGCTKCPLYQRWGISCNDATSIFGQFLAALNDAHTKAVTIQIELDAVKKPQEKTEDRCSAKHISEIERLVTELGKMQKRLKELKALTVICVGEVFYDKIARKFFRIRAIRQGGYVCGGYCNYYDDARRDSSTPHEMTKASLLSNCIKVKTEDLDSRSDLWFYNPNLGWRVKFSQGGG